MAVKINDTLAEVINAPESVKALATVDKNGIPHVVFKGSLRVNEDGQLTFYELLESSQNGKNLVYSIWFGKSVAVNILDKDKNSYEITGRPVRCITCGSEFEKAYEDVRSRLGDVDLAAIWLIEADNIKNETYRVRLHEEEEEFPLIRHLDRIVG